MFFSNPVTIIYLKRNSLEVYNQKTQGVQARLDFPPNYEKDQEIIDIDKFEQLITNFLSKLNLKDKKVIIVVSQEDLFEKTIPLSTKTKEETATKKFFAEVPFDLQKIAKKQIRTKNGLNLFATNKNLFESIVHVLQKLESEIRAAVPSTAFAVTSSALSQEDIKKITSNSEMLKISNFLSTSQKPDKDKEEKTDGTNSQQKSKLSPIVIGGVAFIVAGIIVAGFLLFKNGTIGNFTPSDNEPPPTPSPQESPSTQIDPEDEEASNGAQLSSKKDITIQVLNGSGIAGQASEVQTTLESLEYAQIEVGNAESQDSTATTITYINTENEQYAAEIKAELEKSFSSVNTELSTQEQNFDIVITTGQPS